MVKVTVDADGRPLPCELYLDGYEKSNLDYLNKRVHKNWDFLGVIVGPEGDGKTTKGFQQALYMDHNLSIDNIVFNEQQFLHATETLPPGSSIVWDESDAASGHWASNIVQAIKKRFKRCRKNNYKIFLITPTFFDFDKYFIIHRANFLVDIYAEGLTRGFFRFFGPKKMRNLYFKGKQFWNMRAELPNFIGRFTNYPAGFPIDMSDGGEYDIKKDLAMKEIEETIIDPKQAVIDFRRKVIPLIRAEMSTRDVKLSQRQLARCLDCTASTINIDLKTINSV